MATLASVFPALSFQPDVYYEFLKDLREDAFIGGVNKVIVEVKELFPNTNLIAVLREKAQEFFKEKMAKKEQSNFKALTYSEETDEKKAEEARKEWLALRDKLAAEKNVKQEEYEKQTKKGRN